jgi:hypothetical protein
MQPCAPGLIDKHGFRRSARRITPRYDRARARPLCRKSTAIRRLINTVFDMRAAPARQSENHRCRVTLPEISPFADVPPPPAPPPSPLPACLPTPVERVTNADGYYFFFFSNADEY